VYYATGAEARSPEPGGDVLIENTPVAFDDASAAEVMAGQVRLFIGVRSDPFFADADGSFHGFQWTGRDAFADKNILSIVMEVPHDMLSPDPQFGLWASVSQRQRDGSLVQVDRGGHPTINPFVNPNNVKNTYNLGQPVDDIATYLAPWTKFLQANGGYSAEAAEQAARIVLPDILRYDRGKPVGYPNGRAMTNDTFSARFAWMSNGKIPPQGLKPHPDLLTDFPYLGPPNVYPV
jgi:energy-converting hydrogenase Eha subunit F